MVTHVSFGLALGSFSARLRDEMAPCILRSLLSPWGTSQYKYTDRFGLQFGR
jgi:hypothetical protein